jgi:hypothetical protein
MLFRRISTWCALLPLLASSVWAQGLDTKASKDDWEEINFEFNSSVLVDGFPSLLRIAELLQKNPGYKVTVEGHTDKIGGNGYNDRLGMARATAVRDFLVKYGARTGQIDVRSRGKLDPKYMGGKDVYSRTDEARWMNRRVAIAVLDDQGRAVGAGSAGDTIRALQQPGAAGTVADCCSEVLKKLDKLDAIEQMLKDLADQNKKLQDDLAALKQGQQALENRVGQANQAAQAATQAAQAATQAAAAPRGPSTDEVAKAVTDAIDKKTPPKFQMLGMNVGANQNGDVTFTGKGRYFAPFGDNYAFQSEGEYFYNKGQREGQFDFGLVDRIGRFQAGLFSSFKHVNLTGDQTGGTLGEGAVTLEYLFKWGKVGAFGTKAFLDDALVNSTHMVGGVFNPDFVTERYLRVVDQAGISGTAPLFGKNYFEGNLGYLRSTTAGDRVGGTLRLIFPVSNKIAFTVEGGMNETLLGPGNNGRAVVGVEFGNRLRPTDYLTSKHPVPVQIPRLRYEVLTRTVRVADRPPVANAGPDQTLPGAQTVTLNGSASYSPDGNPITFLWAQTSGPAIALAAPTAAITTFSAAAGQSYTFLLTVTDNLGLKGTASVRITTGSGGPTIISFVANPPSINAGQSSTLSWQVTNADSVSITTLASVALNGAQAVSPLVTTTYVLTAVKGTVTSTANATVTVNGTGGGLPVIASFAANPTTINAGQSSTLTWATQNATTVTITSLSNIPLSGSQSVTPPMTTTYTLTATNAAGSVTAQATVTVNGSASGVSITSFTATPSTIAAGASSVLACVATGATSVAINGVATQGTSATSTVTPPQTTTYTCVATGPNNQTDTRQVTVTVTGGGPPIIVVAGGTNQYLNRRHIVLDATGSTGNGPLTYQWSSNNFGAIGLTGANTATPDIILPPILGSYAFTLTITDSKSVSTTTTIILTLTATNIF